ncbi:MAG: TRAM domain-containing protein, partial [Propionibacteriaceae bacterium]|nr:TRAM domain-containing protein [Propionibacteriaceae bacterium]
MHADAQVGQRFDGVQVGSIAHGGHWVARVEGRVVFVRDALEGETVSIVLTRVAKRHAFADVVEVTVPSPHRVQPPCPVAGTCGGCDFQHVDVAHQRELKRQVVAEHLSRFAQINWEGGVESFDDDALGWRRRMRYHAGPSGWGLRARGSHEAVVLPADGCRIAAREVAQPNHQAADAAAEAFAAVEGDTLVGALAAEGPVWVAPGDDRIVTEQAAGRTWQVRADGFWQVHPAAPDALVDAVLAGVEPRAGESAFDLYCGVGLFAGALVDAGVRVICVEGGRDAVELARRNVAGARFRAGSVDRVLPRLPGSTDIVVLDPPRAGAGATVIAQVCARRPRVVAYVA